MANRIADEYRIKLIEVLTGFKYIGEQIKLFEETKKYEFLFAFEESYGCLLGTHARDKDAVVAVMALCEAAAYYKSKGLTLWDQMVKMYEKYGYYKEKLLCITFEGADGDEKIQKMIERLRENPLEEIGNSKVIKFKDYKRGIMIDLNTKEEQKINLPQSNVLYYDLEDDGWCCVRPSGTEPKIKFYIGVKGNSLEDANLKLKELSEEMEKFAK